YQFTAKAGDTVYFRLAPIQAGSDPGAGITILAFDADQQQIGIVSNGLFKPKVDGTISIVIMETSGTLKVNYALLLVDINGPCGATSIGCGAALDASIADVLSVNLYTLSASKGDVFQFKLLTTDTTGGLQPTYQLLDA